MVCGQRSRLTNRPYHLLRNPSWSETQSRFHSLPCYASSHTEIIVRHASAAFELYGLARHSNFSSDWLIEIPGVLNVQWQGILTDHQAACEGWSQSGLSRPEVVCACCVGFFSRPSPSHPIWLSPATRRGGRTNLTNCGEEVCRKIAKISLWHV